MLQERYRIDENKNLTETGHLHTGTAKGEWGTLGNLKAYITGNKASPRAILQLHDAFGVTLPNAPLLAGTFSQKVKLTRDAYAEKLDARVFLPDFFDGEHIPFDFFSNNEVKMDPDFDLQAFINKNSRAYKLSTIVQAAREIKSLAGVEKLGVIGVHSIVNRD